MAGKQCRSSPRCWPRNRRFGRVHHGRRKSIGFDAYVIVRLRDLHEERRVG